MSLGIDKKIKAEKKVDKSRLGIEDLIDCLKARKWPPSFLKSLPRIVENSWKAYSNFLELMYAQSECSVESIRIAWKLQSSNFLSSPYFFVKWWVLTIVKEELSWRKGVVSKWATWHPRHKLFIEAGRAEAESYCGDPDRFDKFLKEVLK